MDKSVKIRLIDIKIFIISSIILLVALSAVIFVAGSFKNTVHQTYFIIISLSLLGGLNYLTTKKTSRLVKFSIQKEYVSLISQKGEFLFNSKISSLKNYNLYYLIIKKMGYILRLKANQNHYYWITWINFDKKSQKDDDNFKELKTILSTSLKIKKEISLSDRIILTVATLPWIILLIGVLSFIFGIVYLINV